MAGVQKIEDSEPEHNGLKSDSFNTAVQGMASGQDGMPSDSTSSMSVSGDATSSSIKGYNRDFPQLYDHGYYHADGSYTGIQSDNGSLVYNMPGYNQYASENFMGEDGQCHQPYFTSSGSLQPAVSCGPEALPCYSWDSTFVGDAPNETMANSNPRLNASSRTNGWNSLKSNGAVAGKTSTLPLHSKSRQYMASSNFSNSDPHTRPLKPLNKEPYLGSDLQPVGNFSSLSNQRQGVLRYNGPMNYRPDNRMWYESDRYKLREKYSRNAGFEATGECTRGPRAQKSYIANPSVEKQGLGLLTIRRDQYNRQDFQIQYEMAKFYVIKSYSEDDVQKSIKYDVWASTPNGNKKLDAAFREAEAKATDKGLICPIFLFFSVNGSGQFVGLAEMIGPVDFNKDMDFWQLDKWNGFFPVKWHIIKDIPNTKLRHIILENNDNKPVPHSRDTQEIGLKQGLEMLDIFKSYAAKSSILDDFDFYENQKKLLPAKSSSKPASPQAEVYSGGDFMKHMKEERNVGSEVSVRPIRLTDSASSLIDRTKNLIIDDRPLKSRSAPEPLDHPMPSTSSKTF